MGGQAAITFAQGFGRVSTDIDATLSGPGGGVISGTASDARTGFTDFSPQAP